MTATAPRQDSARPEREQEAWDQYRDDLRELEGREYEDAEDRVVGAAPGAPARDRRATARGSLGRASRRG